LALSLVEFSFLDAGSLLARAQMFIGFAGQCDLSGPQVRSRLCWQRNFPVTVHNIRGPGSRVKVGLPLWRVEDASSDGYELRPYAMCGGCVHQRRPVESPDRRHEEIALTENVGDVSKLCLILAESFAKTGDMNS
jgi:hypothetical protein